VNGTMAALAIWLGFTAQIKLGVIERAAHDPFYAGIAFAVACLSLSLFAYVRTRAQRLLTRVVFLRSSVEKMLSRLLEVPAVNSSDSAYLASATSAIGDLFSAKRCELGTGSVPARAIAVSDPVRLQVPGWVQAVAPLRLARGDAHVLWLGARRGGRRYLSEDLETLERLLLTVCEQVERIRAAEVQALVSQAELRALQAQINPHFLFNALNTLYGVIGRENPTARKLVLNLSNLFRSSFATSSSLSPLEQELRIVRAYLEIEVLRLGSRLRTEFEVDESLLLEKVPVLSIQPLVENAVKHGVAGRHGSGFVRVSVQKQATTIVVAVSNSGSFRPPARGREGHGIGMANVRRRLTLCYGNSSELEVSTAADVTTVRFTLPLSANCVVAGEVA
jgi:two-component system LytT family sensor kinase